MNREGDVVPLDGRQKRLKSLDEFEMPPWGRPAALSKRTSFGVLVTVAAIIGFLGGLFLPI